jgi:glutamine synthetase
VDINAVARLIDDNHVRSVKIGGGDLDGVYRGKRVGAEHFLSAAEGEGFPQCDVLFGWDIQDEVIGSLPFSNWETGFGDIVMRPDLTTFAVVPWEEGCASVVCDFFTEHGISSEALYSKRRTQDISRTWPPSWKSGSFVKTKRAYARRTTAICGR